MQLVDFTDEIMRLQEEIDHLLESHHSLGELKKRNQIRRLADKLIQLYGYTRVQHEMDEEARQIKEMIDVLYEEVENIIPFDPNKKKRR